MSTEPLTLAIKSIARSEVLTPAELDGAFNVILQGDAAPEHIGAFLMGLAVRGETSAELIAGAKVLRRQARQIKLDGDVLDTCGTGGLPWTSLNTSTAAALVIAACGGTVAKHGNRSVPPKTGSADVLEELGVEIDLSETQFHACIAQAGIGFLFARSHHSAMRHVAPVRQSLGIRTIFNLLGPLSNPASATHQILGVYEARWLRPMAETLRDLGIKRAWVVHGPDPEMNGIDELSIAGDTQIVDVRDGALHDFTVRPEDAGLRPHSLSALRGGSPKDNADAIHQLLEGRSGPFQDAVALNAAAGLLVLGKAPDLRNGTEQAKAALESGAALKTLSTLRSASKGLPVE